MRERVEDLGRIAVLLDQATESSILHTQFLQGRTKDFEEKFMSWSEEKQRDWLHEVAYGIESLRSELLAILEIAQGKDELNVDENL